MKRAALALSISMLLVVPVSAEQQLEGHRGPVLTVKGEAKTEVKPDFARFDVTVSAAGQSLDAAGLAHESRATRAIAELQALKAQGVEIEKSSFRLNQDRPPAPVAGYGEPPPKVTPPPPPKFTAVTTFSLKLNPIHNINPVISKLAESGLFETRSVVFKAEDERAVLLRARRAAMTDARAQAEAYADAGDLKLVEILEITDGEARPYEQGAADMPAPRYVQIIPPATVTFTASVNVTWRIAPR